MEESTLTEIGRVTKNAIIGAIKSREGSPGNASQRRQGRGQATE